MSIGDLVLVERISGALGRNKLELIFLGHFYRHDYTSLDDLKTGLNDLVESASYVRKLICKPSEDGDGAKGGDAEIEVYAELVGCCVCDTAEDGATMHLREDPEKTDTEGRQQKGEAPVNEGMRLKRVGIPCNESKNEDRRDEKHLISDIDEYCANKSNIADDDELFGQLDQ